MSPAVSVHITTCNRAELLPRCLDSVLAQEFRDMEILVVDDGSTDRTPEVVREYRNRDSRIRYIRHTQNRGNAAARNTALKQTSAPLVAFLDDDDEWTDPGKIARQVELFGELPGRVAILCTGVTLVDGEGNRREKRVRHPEDLVKHILTRNGIIYSPTVMTRRSVMEEVGGFDERMPRGVDSEFYRNCIVRHGYEVHFQPEVTTAVHEYGAQRMSPVHSREQQLKIIRASLRLLQKYRRHYLRHPGPLLKRLGDIARNTVKLLINTIRS